MGRNSRPDERYDVRLGGLTHGLPFVDENRACSAAQNLARQNGTPTQVVDLDTGQCIASYDRDGQRLP